MHKEEASGDVLDSTPKGEWEVQSVKSDAIERVTRSRSRVKAPAA